jgi:hypothetical protein
MAKKNAKSPRSRTTRPKRREIKGGKSVEEVEWQIHEPFQGDESEVQWDDEGMPRPGTAWEVAMDHAEKLAQKRQPRSSHLGVSKVYESLGIGKAFGGLYLFRDEKRPRRGRFVRLDVMTQTEWSGFEIEKPLSLEREFQIARVIAECGRAMVLAYFNKDHEFFDELARVVNIDFGVRRKKPRSNEELIVEKAVELWRDWQGNPSREAVILEVKRSGVVIRPKDWPGYFKRCKLDFLKSHKGAGRPRKVEPLERFVIENPKGNFTIHLATQTQGKRLKYEAAQEMRWRAEAEERGEEYIPF